MAQDLNCTHAVLKSSVAIVLWSWINYDHWLLLSSSLHLIFIVSIFHSVSVKWSLDHDLQRKDWKDSNILTICHWYLIYSEIMAQDLNCTHAVLKSSVAIVLWSWINYDHWLLLSSSLHLIFIVSIFHSVSVKWSLDHDLQRKDWKDSNILTICHWYLINSE